MRISTKVIIDIETGDTLLRESYEYDGPCDRLCGPTTQQNQLQGSSQAFAQTLQNSYSTLFGSQQSTLANLNAKIGQIATGTTGPGFSGAENASNISQIQNTSAAAGRNADQATADYLAGSGGGGTSGIRSGVQGELKAQTATGAENNEANALLENTQQNFKVGRENAAAAEGGYAALAGEESPNSAASGAINENQNSFGQATQIQQEDNALAKDIGGGITSLASAALTGGMSSLAGAGGGSSVGQVEQESQGNYADNYIQPPIAPTVAPPMAFPG